MHLRALLKINKFRAILWHYARLVSSFVYYWTDKYSKFHNGLHVQNRLSLVLLVSNNSKRVHQSSLVAWTTAFPLCSYVDKNTQGRCSRIVNSQYQNRPTATSSNPRMANVAAWTYAPSRQAAPESRSTSGLDRRHWRIFHSTVFCSFSKMSLISVHSANRLCIVYTCHCSV